jgi:arginine/lysine/ornithine decarboxylase
MVVTTGIPVVPAITTDDVALIIDANEAGEIQTDSNFYCQFGDPETFKNSRFQQVTYWARTSQPNSTMAKLRKLNDLIIFSSKSIITAFIHSMVFSFHSNTPVSSSKSTRASQQSKHGRHGARESPELPLVKSVEDWAIIQWSKMISVCISLGL